MGLSRASKNESFKWSDGDEVGFVNWADGKPGTGTTSNCVSMQYADGLWSNGACTGTKSWFCKIGRGQSME